MIETTAGPVDVDAAPVNRSPDSARPAFLQGLRAGRYPVVPKVLAVAVDALDGVDALEHEVMKSQREGLGPFCQRVAADVLAGRGYPADFAEAAYLAQQAADRQNAQSLAVQQVRRDLLQQFAGVVGGALPELLDGLRGQLGEIMAELRDVDQTIGGLDMADPEAVAAATDEQRAAVLSFAEGKRRYNLLRLAQRDALEASGTKPPGVTDLTYDHGWRQVFASGVHEVSDPHQFGRPSEDIRSAARFRALAHRSDVWLPTIEEMHAAWDRLHPQPVTKVVPVPQYNSLLRSSS